jgi:hypothetical protein
MRKQLIPILTLILVSSALASGQERTTPAETSARAEVLVLGAYHMANPGRDIFNTQADDVLVPKRQAEIAQLLEVLKKFQPTKIAIESDPGGPRPGQYSEYVAGKRELTRNEIEQLGFRLAKELGHKTIYPVDADGDFPYLRLVNYAKGAGRSKELDAMMAGIGERVKAQSAYLASHTVLETLLYINADDYVAQDLAFYYRQARFGEPGDWAGADLLSEWFKRNIRIYSNVMRLVESPNERILVIYGSGHLGWLRQDFAGNPDLRLRKLAEFVK